MSNTTILVKESLSISCTANNVDFMGIVKVEHSTPGKNSSTFSMNGVLKTPYKERGRYMLDYQRDRMRNVSTLHITFKGCLMDGIISGLKCLCSVIEFL